MLLFLIAGAALAADPVVLARGGHALADVVASGKEAAGPAEEIRGWLDRVTGAHFVVRKEAEADPRRAWVLVRAAAKLPPESFAIRTAPNRVVIEAGSNSRHDRGLSYAAADFIERELGVRWLWPGDLGTVVPRRPDLAVGPVDRRDAPAIHIRKLRDGIVNRNPGKLGRGATALGLDEARHDAMIAASAQWLDRMKTGSLYTANYGHAFNDWRAKYEASHPEFFAMMPDGSRKWPFDNDRVKLCVSNPAVAQQWLENAREYLKRNPDSISVSASPNDNAYQGHCLCPACERLDAPEAPTYPMQWRADGKDATRNHVLLGDRYAWFYNTVADLLAREFPGKLVGAYAYGGWKNPPLRIRAMRPNVMIGYVGNSDMYLIGEDRREDLAQWDAWAKMASKLFYRPNLLNSGHGLPLIYIHKLAADFRHRSETGMMGVDFDSLLHQWSTQGLNYYVLAKLMWNPRADVDALLEDYCRAGFGPAAEPMKRYYLALEKRTDWIAENSRRPERRDRDAFLRRVPEFYSAAVLAEWRGLLAAALDRVSADSDYARRIRWTGLGLDFAEMMQKDAPQRNAWYRAHLYDWSIFGPLLQWSERGR